MTPTERQAARDALAEATGRDAKAQAALAAATDAVALATAEADALIRRAAAGSAIPAADLVTARRAIDDARAARDLAQALADAVRDAMRTGHRAVADAAELDRKDRVRAAYERRLAAAERLDAALGEADAALAEMATAGREMKAHGGPEWQEYFVSLQRAKPDTWQWSQHNLRGIGDIERAAHAGAMQGYAAAVSFAEHKARRAGVAASTFERN